MAREGPFLERRFASVCAALLRGTSAAVCPQASADFLRGQRQWMVALREFLRGERDGASYQDRVHRIYLEFQVALEHLLGAEQLQAFMSLAPGDDMFLVMMGWFVGLPPGFTLGDAVRRQAAGGPVEPAVRRLLVRGLPLPRGPR